MPVVHVLMASGQPPEIRRRLFGDEVTDAVSRTLELPERADRVLITEVGPCDYLAGTETLAERTARQASTEQDG